MFYRCNCSRNDAEDSKRNENIREKSRKVQCIDPVNQFNWLWSILNGIHLLFLRGSVPIQVKIVSWNIFLKCTTLSPSCMQTSFDIYQQMFLSLGIFSFDILLNLQRKENMEHKFWNDLLIHRIEDNIKKHWSYNHLPAPLAYQAALTFPLRSFISLMRI